MNKRVAKVLSCDHTFKTSKHVGVTREDDGKFVCQFQNVFLGLNENGEVLTWRFTKSTAYSEIDDLIKELKTRFDREGVPLEMIIVDDCCHVRNLYERIFPGVKIRLDLFHACSRIVQTISKKDSYGKQFSSELSLILRRNGDLGTERTTSTPGSDEIEANLERLLFSWKDRLPKETLHQLECLRKHIQKGCLSDIPPGCGTQKNERLHRHINRSLLCGVSKIGPELAIAVMSCALFAWNCKRQINRLTSRAKPVMPVEIIREGNLSSPQQHMKQLEISHAEDFMSTRSNVNFPRLVERLKTRSIIDYIIQRVLHLQDFMDTFRERCKNKTVDILAFLWSTSLKTENFIEVEKKMNSLELDLTAQHMNNLIRNLSGFNLEVDKIERDGNCFFQAVASQLNRHSREYREHIEEHCTYLGLGISEAFDTRRLRELFVKKSLITLKSTEPG